jgi:hypothetical protein
MPWHCHGIAMAMPWQIPENMPRRGEAPAKSLYKWRILKICHAEAKPRRGEALKILKEDRCLGSEKGQCLDFEKGQMSWFWKKDRCLGFEKGQCIDFEHDRCRGFGKGQIFGNA